MTGSVGSTCNGAGQHGLAGTRRSNQQDALGQMPAQSCELGGVAQVVHNLLHLTLQICRVQLQ